MMDRIIAILVLLASIHFTNCRGLVPYHYTDDCIKVTVEISAKIVTPTKDTMVVDGKDFSNEKALFCNNDTKNGDAELDIVWMGNQYSLTLHFSRNITSWEVSRIQFEYSANSHLNIDGDTAETSDTNITNVELGSSYKCNSSITYTMIGDNNSTVYLTLKDLQLQAFQFNNQGEFGKAKECVANHGHHGHHGKQKVVVIDENKTCIHVRIVMENISITYYNQSGNKIMLVPIIANITNSSKQVFFSCNTSGESRSAKITIGLSAINQSHLFYNLSIAFSANFKKGQQGWNVGKMTFRYINNSDFRAPVEDNATLYYNKPFTDNSISLTRSYKCSRNEIYKFTSKDSNSTAMLYVSSIQLQAFQFSDPTTLPFGSAGASSCLLGIPTDNQQKFTVDGNYATTMECDQGATNVIVPILVGSALGLFVIILLLAYVVGRCRQLRKLKSGYRPL